MTADTIHLTPTHTIHTATPAIPSADATLLGLAAEFRNCAIRGNRKGHSGAPDRSDILLMAICSMTADGPTGAAVQADAVMEVAERLEWSKALRRVCTDFAHDSIRDTFCRVDIGGTLEHHTDKWKGAVAA
jgi:hypothetical protein